MNDRSKEDSKIRDQALAQLDQEYHSDYENEPIGGGNPYWRCVHCQRSDPQINMKVSNHLSSCRYRQAKELAAIRKLIAAKPSLKGN